MKTIRDFLSDLYYDTFDTMYWLTGSNYMYQFLYKRKWKGSRDHENIMKNKNWYSLPPNENSTSRAEGAIGVITFLVAGRLLRLESNAGILVKNVSSNVIQGPAGTIAYQKLLNAMKSTGPKIPLVTKLDQIPKIGRALSTAYGYNANSIANAARIGGKIYKAEIPKELIVHLEHVGLVQKITVNMGNKIGIEYRFLPAASEFIVPFFR